MNDYVKIVEVGPRDGLQNEKQALSIEQRLSFINDLIDAGLKFIEVGSCVSAKWVPQMSQSDELFKLLPQRDDLNLSLLTPNLKGFDAALAVGCKEVAVFTAASESFTERISTARLMKVWSDSLKFFKPRKQIMCAYAVMCLVWWIVLMKVQLIPNRS